MHAGHLRDKNIRAARNGDPGVCSFLWDVESKWGPPDNKSPILPIQKKFFGLLSDRPGTNSLLLAIHFKIMFFFSFFFKKENSHILKCMDGIKKIFRKNKTTVSGKFISFSLTWQEVNWPQPHFMPTFSFTSCLGIREGVTYDGHFLLQVIHVLGSPFLLGGSVIFVLCGGNAVTVWPSILQTHTNVLHMPSDLTEKIRSLCTFASHCNCSLDLTQ